MRPESVNIGYLDPLGYLHKHDARATRRAANAACQPRPTRRGQESEVQKIAEIPYPWDPSMYTNIAYFRLFGSPGI